MLLLNANLFIFQQPLTIRVLKVGQIFSSLDPIVHSKQWLNRKFKLSFEQIFDEL